MIKSEKGIVEIKGSEPQILAEAAAALKNIREILTERNDDKYAEEAIHKVFELSLKEEDEIEKLAMDALMKLFLQ